MQFKNFEAEKHRYGHHDILGGAARARVHVVCLISLNRIQSQQYVENEERANNEDCQVPQLMLLLILPIEQCVANEDCVKENDKHIWNFDPFVVVVLRLVAYWIEHVIASFDKEPHDHQNSGALHHYWMGQKLEVRYLVVVVRDAQMHSDIFPEQGQRRYEEGPHEKKVSMKYVK